eukprot:CAMPEP_0181310166 /NCGR_PEP_ID=MMETSP1101-20121128/12438_1 /TAXON_ID=46948 /ORGANISM="Rhodomonas abbreviata, Strain Caron Lab Isolate" /LENGTH=323 /DNA_ID=CAMNT_0023416771 /DNA_START=228 /DNA_END=1199 /DNA_ORIENTATION=-
MTFGWGYSSQPIDNAMAGEMVDFFFSKGHSQVDTARTYAAGKTEEMLGEIMPSGSDRSSKCSCLATKAGPWDGPSMMSGNGGLSTAQLREKVVTSLQCLKQDSIDLLYLHGPDSGTAIEETLEEVNKLHQEGKIKALGLSNFQAWEVAHIHGLCSARGYLKPSVYQGMYNAITREVERELFPCLRKHNIAFYAYNPLAGGLLTGKHTQDAAPAAGRFKDNKMYTDRFWKPSYFAAADSIKGACERESVKMVEAAMIWMQAHSQLKDGDGIIIGASSTAQLETNLEALQKGKKLPDSVVSAMDAAWESCQRDCPSYERGTSKLA